MPYVHVKLVGSITREEKAKIAEEMTATLQRHAHKPPQYTTITFEEVNDDHWAIGGKLLDE